MQPEIRKCVKALFVRHGETEDNKTRTIAGQRPGKLTEIGRAQAQKIGLQFAKDKREFDFIYVSDLGRTKETFQNAVSKYPYLKKVSTEFTPLVRERSGGILEGKPLNSWQQGAKKQGKNIRDFKCEGSECWLDVNKRASTLLETLIKKHIIGNKDHKEVKVLIVTHGGFIMQFINVFNRIQGREEKFQNSARNCSMHEFQICYPEEFYGNYVEKKVELKYVLENFVGHLS